VEARVHGDEVPVQAMKVKNMILMKCTYVSLFSSIIEPLSPSTETVTSPRLAAREDLDAAADRENFWLQELPPELTFRNAFLPKPINSLGRVAVARFQRLFAVQHGCAGAVAKNLHVGGRHGGEAAHKRSSNRGAVERHHFPRHKQTCLHLKCLRTGHLPFTGCCPAHAHAAWLIA
jgi:hypothetical protein